ncbi:MAG: efflux RND transporter periplasmic adaptor subunit [Myxococcales bacterium]|nr:efflux RND transporter periplasmic adaptor subunit [Myxococcales bacterium]
MRTRTLATLAALVASLTTSACAQPAAEEARAEATARAPIDVHVATVQTRTRPSSLTLDGTLVADEESSVTSVVSGRVMAVKVERGSVVEADAPLVELRDVDYRLQAKAAKAQLSQARAQLGMRKGGSTPAPDDTPAVISAKSDMELADADLGRIEALAKDGVVSSQDLDNARSRAVSARERYRSAVNGARASIAAVQGARAALEQAKTAASETTVRAPFAGEVADRMISVGEFVDPQTPLVTIVRTDPLRIELSVPQQHLRDVQPGQVVTLSVDAFGSETFEATVRYVNASVSRDTRSLRVEAVVPNPDRRLRPGLFATAHLQTGGQQEVAEIPAAALHTEAGVSRVFVVADGAVTERVVSIADRVEDRVVVEDGLSAGEQVAIDGLDRLGDGVPVNVLEGAAAGG